ncbi:MAG: hypothetical protein AABX82_03415, partial [Nanoarchaeota archaeon]
IEGFRPRKKVAFLIQGQGGAHNASFNSIIDLLIVRGYDYITACRNTVAGAFCRDITSVTKKNIVDKISNLADELTEQDVLFTAILGASVLENGRVYIPDNNLGAIWSYELRDALGMIPAHHVIHYVSPDRYAGNLARTLSGARHPDLGKRHIAIAPTIPRRKHTFRPHTPKSSREAYVNAFHFEFFNPQNRPSLEARFTSAAEYQHRHCAPHRLYKAYMRTNVDPQTVVSTQ